MNPVTNKAGKSSALPQVLLDAFHSEEVITSDGRKLPLDANVSQTEAEQLYAVVKKLRPETTAEVGLAKGVSTVAILQALADGARGAHHVVDPFQADWGDSGLELVKRAGLEERFHFYRQFPEEVLPKLGPIQFAFIDASHLVDLTLMEFILMDKKLAVGGVVGFHDTWMPAVQRVVRFILRNRHYELFQKPQAVSWRERLGKLLCLLPWSDRILSQELLRPILMSSHGNLILLRKTGDDDRDIRYYREF